MKVLLIDIETAPNLGYTWEKYEQNVIRFVTERYMLSFSYKWLGEKSIHSFSLPDFKLYKENKENDASLTAELWKLFDDADFVIGHNSDQFDIRMAYTFFAKNGLLPPKPFKTIDTKKIAKRYFKFNSNKLDDLGQYLGLGRKQETGGFDLWEGCMAGDMNSWNKMVKYNKQDVLLLEKIYLYLRPYMINHPSLNIDKERESCACCGSIHTQSRGFSYTITGKKQRIQCQDCGKWSLGKFIKR